MCKLKSTLCEFCQGWLGACCVSCHLVTIMQNVFAWHSLYLMHLLAAWLEFAAQISTPVLCLFLVWCLHVCTDGCCTWSVRALLFVCLSTLSACSQLIKAWCQLSCFLPCCLSGVTSSRHHLPLLLVLLLRSCSSSHLNWVVPSLNSLRTLLLDFASPYFFFLLLCLTTLLPLKLCYRPHLCVSTCV